MKEEAAARAAAQDLKAAAVQAAKKSKDVMNHEKALNADERLYEHSKAMERPESIELKPLKTAPRICPTIRK